MVDFKHPTALVMSTDDLDRPLVNLLNEATIHMEWGASEAFLQLMDEIGLTRRGKFSWALSTKDNGHLIARFLKRYAEEFVPYTMFSPMDMAEDMDYNTPASSYVHYNREHQPALYTYSRFRMAAERLEDFVMPTINVDNAYITLMNGRWNRNQDDIRKLHTAGFVMVELKNDMFWVRLTPAVSLYRFNEQVQLPKTRNTGYRTAQAMPPRKVLEFLKKFTFVTRENLFDSRSDELFPLVEKAKDVVTVGYAANKPASVLLYRGENVSARRGTKLSRYSAGKEHTVPLDEVLMLQKHAKNVEYLVHPGLADIVNMAQAEDYMDEPRLKPYQKKAVGLHLSTNLGYVQTCSPGMGKTVMQLVAMRARSQKINNYRGLVVCEANVRDQWAEEAQKWFPEAKVLIIRTYNDTDELVEALGEAGPVVIIMSYSHTLLAYEEKEARKALEAKLNQLTFVQKLKALREMPIPALSVGGMLLDGYWHDICADEAVVIRNGTSKQSQIMWDLRKNSEVATALTATPINKSPDDIGRLIAWVRNDRNLFTGAPLAEQYDTSTVDGAKKLFKIFGPLVFRRDTSEISDELPEVKPNVHLLKPSAAERALASAAERELKRCYLELLAALEEVEKAGNNTEEVKKAKEQLRAANGAWLGGTQLARMATSDPSALLDSESVGAALLTGQGLVQEAMKNEPTKRKKFIEEAQKHVANGEQLLVFTEFETVARRLVDALQENGINAKAYTGKNGTVRDRARKDFQDGNLDVLVCTKAGERGLTLHKAAAIYHYDLPWTLERLIQRTGRGVRIGSENKEFKVVFLVMEGTVEQRMADNLVDLGIAASLILDNSRGVDVKKTETASAMGGLMTAVSKTSDKSSVVEFGKMLLGV